MLEYYAFLHHFPCDDAYGNKDPQETALDKVSIARKSRHYSMSEVLGYSFVASDTLSITVVGGTFMIS